jgi:hypothetical protein
MTEQDYLKLFEQPDMRWMSESTTKEDYTTDNVLIKEGSYTDFFKEKNEDYKLLIETPNYTEQFKKFENLNDGLDQFFEIEIRQNGVKSEYLNQKTNFNKSNDLRETYQPRYDDVDEIVSLAMFESLNRKAMVQIATGIKNQF